MRYEHFKLMGERRLLFLGLVRAYNFIIDNIQAKPRNTNRHPNPEE